MSDFPAQTYVGIDRFYTTSAKVGVTCHFVKDVSGEAVGLIHSTASSAKKDCAARNKAQGGQSFTRPAHPSLVDKLMREAAADRTDEEYRAAIRQAERRRLAA